MTQFKSVDSNEITGKRSVDSPKWAMVQAFTGPQAATLVCGIDPSSADSATVTELLQRMKHAYAAALWAHKACRQLLSSKISPVDVRSLFPFIEIDTDPFDNRFLHSRYMTEYYEEVCQHTDPEFGAEDSACVTIHARFREWLADDVQTDFNRQLFDPHELHVWLKHSCLHSAYNFLRQGEKSDSSDEQSIVPRRVLKQRRNVLDPVIEHAQSLCKEPTDASEVWVQLQTLARSKPLFPPFIGVTAEGIQYLDSKDEVRYLNVKALRMRLLRARQTTVGHGG
jgi:hypothetical protein